MLSFQGLSGSAASRRRSPHHDYNPLQPPRKKNEKFVRRSEKRCCHKNGMLKSWASSVRTTTKGLPQASCCSKPGYHGPRVLGLLVIARLGLYPRRIYRHLGSKISQFRAVSGAQASKGTKPGAAVSGWFDRSQISVFGCQPGTYQIGKPGRKTGAENRGRKTGDRRTENRGQTGAVHPSVPAFQNLVTASSGGAHPSKTTKGGAAVFEAIAARGARGCARLPNPPDSARLQGY